MRSIPPILEKYLLNNDGMLAPVFGAFDLIWIPPSVELRLCAPTPFAPQNGGEIPTLIYPVPREWQPHVSDMFDLEVAGWQRQEKTEGMLNSFLGLAQDAHPQRVQDKVRAFVERFGPLWLCRAHSDCHWSGTRHNSQPIPCSWMPMEEVSAFVQEAQYVQAVLESVKLLQDGKPVPRQLEEHLPYVLEGESLQAQRILLTFIVNARLSSFDGARLHLAWYQGEKPTLDISSGFGFLTHVWLEVAQMVCNVNCIPQCTGCGERYPRDHKPQSGRGNYCERCGTKAAKRDYAARKRALVRQAQQLRAEGFTYEEISQQLKPSAGRIKIDPETVQKWVSLGL